MGKPAAEIRLPSLVALNPEVLVVVCCGYSLAMSSREMAVLERQKDWMSLQAVGNNRVYVVDGDRSITEP